MRVFSFLMIPSLATLALSSIAWAGPAAVSPNSGNSASGSIYANDWTIDYGNNPSPGASIARAEISPSPHLLELIALRTRALNEVKQDGGKLTPQHYAQIQGELNAINTKYRRTPSDSLK